MFGSYVLTSRDICSIVKTPFLIRFPRYKGFENTGASLNSTSGSPMIFTVAREDSEPGIVPES